MSPAGASANVSATPSEREILATVDALAERTVEPFSDEAKAPLLQLSKMLMSADLATQQPQLRVLGFWLRGAALQRLQRDAACSDSEVRVARGLAYHLPPTNVDTLFAYSWAVSTLLGNCNVTRLPSTTNETTSWLLDRIHEALDITNQHSRHLFCHFDHSSTLSAELSARADLRVVWGGDAKVLDVSRLPTRPDGLTLGFADRKSIAIIGTDAYSVLDDAARDELASRLCNDMYWFDQMACSSPRLLVWLGEPRDNDREDFLSRVADKAKSGGHDVPLAQDIEKFVLSNALLASDGASRATRHSALLTTADVPLDRTTLDTVQGAGFMMNASANQLSELKVLARRELQTIATFGLTIERKRELASLLGARGGCRIVPIGEALNFSTVWDGVDLIAHFSRFIAIS